jgi:Aminotransferase class I and II
MVPTYCYGGPVPVAALATTLLGLEANEHRGDELRAQLHRRTRTLLDHLDKLGIATSNTSGFPLVELALADPADAPAAGRHLFERGIYVTMAPYPVVPREEVGFRVQLTAAHTPDQVDHLLAVLGELDDRCGLRRPTPERAQLTSAITSSGMSKLAYTSWTSSRSSRASSRRRTRTAMSRSSGTDMLGTMVTSAEA